MLTRVSLAVPQVPTGGRREGDAVKSKFSECEQSPVSLVVVNSAQVQALPILIHL